LLDLETISLHSPVEELTATADARELVSDAAARYSAERSIEPAIVALRGHIFELLDREIERAKKRGAGPETEAALRHLASVLLHTPSVLGREAALDGRGQEFVDGLESIFGVTAALAVEDPHASEASA
jgi:glutamyl-tRNA reductase